LAAETYPLPKPAKVIGTPYQGTHAKAFNVKGGSNNWESENAVDLATPKGTPIYAVASGTIGSQIGAQGGGRFAGLRVHLTTGSNEYYYAHLSRLVVKAGETVQAGQLIGYSGVANGVAHLHFAAKTGDPRAIFSQGGGDTVAPTPTQTGAPAGDQTGTPAVSVTDTRQIPDFQGAGTPDYQPPTLNEPAYGPGQVAKWWQQIASQPYASPETQSWAQNVNSATGG